MGNGIISVENVINVPFWKRTNDSLKHFRNVSFELENISGLPTGQPAYFVIIFLKMSKNTKAASDAAFVKLTIFDLCGVGRPDGRLHQ